MNSSFKQKREFYLFNFHGGRLKSFRQLGPHADSITRMEGRVEPSLSGPTNCNSQRLAWYGANHVVIFTVPVIWRIQSKVKVSGAASQVCWLDWSVLCISLPDSDLTEIIMTDSHPLLHPLLIRPSTLTQSCTWFCSLPIVERQAWSLGHHCCIYPIRPVLRKL